MFDNHQKEVLISVKLREKLNSSAKGDQKKAKFLFKYLLDSNPSNKLVEFAVFPKPSIALSPADQIDFGKIKAKKPFNQ